MVERVNPKPLSVAAMMRKRENEDDYVPEKTRGGGLTRTMLGSASSGAILQRTPAPSTLAHINNAGRRWVVLSDAVESNSYFCILFRFAGIFIFIIF